MQTAIDAVTAHYGRLDIGINNAGIGFVGDVTETTEEDYDRLMAVNVKGVFLCAQAEVRWMKEHGGGAIINTASVAGLVGVDRRFAYSTTKGAVTAMTKQLAVDHVKDRIRVNCVCPGTVETPFVDAYLAKYHAGEEEATKCATARPSAARPPRPAGRDRLRDALSRQRRSGLRHRLRADHRWRPDGTIEREYAIRCVLRWEKASLDGGTMQLGYFTMPLHPPGADIGQTMADDLEQ